MNLNKVTHYFYNIMISNKSSFSLIILQGIILGFFFQTIISEKFQISLINPYLPITFIFSIVIFLTIWILYAISLSKIILNGISRSAIYEVLKYDSISYIPFSLTLIIWLIYYNTTLQKEYSSWFIIIGLLLVVLLKIVILSFKPPNREVYLKERSQQVKIKHVSRINDLPGDKTVSEKIKVNPMIPVRKYIVNDEIRNAIDIKNHKTGTITIPLKDKNINYTVGWKVEKLRPQGNLKLYVKSDSKKELIFNKDAINILAGWNEYQIILEKKSKTVDIIWENTISDDLFISFSDLSTVKSEKKNKNIVVIVFDGIRPNTIGLYRGEKDSDNISCFFKDSIIFKNSYAQGEWTMPDLASIATSLYPSHHGVNDPDLYSSSIPHDINTMAEILQENGYNTFGYTSHNRVSPGYGHARGFNRFIFRCTFDEFTKRREEFAKAKRHSSDVKLTDIQRAGNNNIDIFYNTMKFLRDNPDTNNFVFLHVFDTHQPFYQSPGNVSTKEAVYNKIAAEELNKKDLGEEGFNFLRDLYQQKFKEVDENVSILFDYIQKYENDHTTVILTSDHGTLLFDKTAKNMLPPGKDGRNRYLVETRIKSPYLIKIPNCKKSEIRDKLIEGNISILPTVLDIANISLPKNIDGISVLDGKKYSKGYTITESNYKDRYEVLIIKPDYTYLYQTNRNREKNEILTKPGKETFYYTETNKLIKDEEKINKIKKEVIEILKSNNLSCYKNLS